MPKRQFSTKSELKRKRGLELITSTAFLIPYNWIYEGEISDGFCSLENAKDALTAQWWWCNSVHGLFRAEKNKLIIEQKAQPGKAIRVKSSGWFSGIPNPIKYLLNKFTEYRLRRNVNKSADVDTPPIPVVEQKENGVDTPPIPVVELGEIWWLRRCAGSISLLHRFADQLEPLVPSPSITRCIDDRILQTVEHLTACVVRPDGEIDQESVLFVAECKVELDRLAFRFPKHFDLVQGLKDKIDAVRQHST